MTDFPVRNGIMFGIHLEEPRMRHLTRRTSLALLACGALAAPLSFAQTAWPNRPVKIVVPFAPGGTTDILARAIAPDLRRSGGQIRWRRLHAADGHGGHAWHQPCAVCQAAL